jgi:hypothetical protein
LGKFNGHHHWKVVGVPFFDHTMGFDLKTGVNKHLIDAKRGKNAGVGLARAVALFYKTIL